MADVIQLRERVQRHPRKTPAATPADGRAHDMAVVLMFTGIRYERLETQTLPMIIDPAQHGIVRPH